MTVKTLAAQLNIPVRELEREVSQTWIDHRLLEIESELVILAQKYKVANSNDFIKQSKQGKIHEDRETLDDFFRLDYLEAERKSLKNLKNKL